MNPYQPPRSEVKHLEEPPPAEIAFLTVSRSKRSRVLTALMGFPMAVACGVITRLVIQGMMETRPTKFSLIAALLVVAGFGLTTAWSVLAIFWAWLQKRSIERALAVLCYAIFGILLVGLVLWAMKQISK